jgi:hypothetical protein
MPTGSEAGSIMGASSPGPISSGRAHPHLIWGKERARTGSLQVQPKADPPPKSSMGCRGQWPLQASAVAGEPSGRTFYFRSRLQESGEKKEILWPEWIRTRRGHCVFAGILNGWRQVGANNVGWP